MNIQLTRAMPRKYSYHRENCTTCVRLSIVDILGRTIVLSGTHAFEWQVTIIDKSSITIIGFKGRVDATREFNKYRRKK